MPTAYTAAIEEGANLNARDFVSHCARAFGSFIHQRDESLDSPLRLPSGTDSYYIKEAEKARSRVVELDSMTPEEIKSHWEAEVARVEAENAASVEQSRVITERYDSVRAKVESWEPNKEALPIKKYALDQIDSSKEYVGPFIRIAPATPDSWFKQESDFAHRNLVYYVNKVEEEKTRNAEKIRMAEKIIESIESVPE